MTREAFDRAMRLHYHEHQKRYPAMQAEDTVKFIFQGMLGVGHLLSARERVAAYIASEAAENRADPLEPLFEELSPDWCRMNLRRAMAEQLDPDTIAGMMAASRAGHAFTREDVQETCRRWEAAGETGPLDSADPGRITEESFLPSHSAAYRAAYRPAYRVVSAGWMQRMEAVRQIAAKRSARRLLVTIDGPCATGKTTFAQQLAEVFRGFVVHTDDFVIPHARKTPERLAVPGGNCDADRLAAEVAAPWKRGDPVRYRKYDWTEDCLLPPQALPEEGVLILEGSYCNLPVIRQHADIRIFLDAPWETRIRRLEKRESADSLKRFFDRWIPLEDAYFSAYRLPDEGCMLLK